MEVVGHGRSRSRTGECRFRPREPKRHALPQMLVPGRRLELPRPLSHWYLKPARLPFRHPGRCRRRGHIRAGVALSTAAAARAPDSRPVAAGIAGWKERPAWPARMDEGNRSRINAIADGFAVRYTPRRVGSLLGRPERTIRTGITRARNHAMPVPIVTDLRRVRLHRPPGRPAHGAGRLAGAGGGSPARTRRTSSAPTGSSARSSRSRPTSATRPRRAPPSPGPRRSSTASASWPRPAGRPSRRSWTKPPAGSPGSAPRKGSPASSTSPPSAPTRRATASMPPPRAAARRRCAPAFPDAVLLRPSIVFGSDDSFFNRFGAMARFCPSCRWSDRRRASSRSTSRTWPRPPWPPPPPTRRPASTSSAAPRWPPSAS